ncbi:MAG: hypothetical protein P8H56_04980 [Crocinitomicaceae bacterium]|jgi:hypothetical protein|nr:hypothetical protein [Crocinitomicaceae bacterium]MDG1657917.1 hypothetical protein [Crocinitomicaceae bacterium]
MKRVTRTFIISNIISAIALVLALPGLSEQRDDMWSGKQDESKAYALLIAILVGFVTRVMKAREVAKNGVGQTSTFEKLFLCLLVVFGISVSLNFTMFSCSYFFGGPSSTSATVYIVSLMGTSIIIMFYEAAVILGAVQYKPSVVQKKWLNPMHSFYVGMGVALSWDIMIVGGSNGLSYGMENFWSEFVASIFLALMMVVSVQRLFWFEVFLNSAGWKDNLKVLASLVVVIACALIPLFYI